MTTDFIPDEEEGCGCVYYVRYESESDGVTKIAITDANMHEYPDTLPGDTVMLYDNPRIRAFTNPIPDIPCLDYPHD